MDSGGVSITPPLTPEQRRALSEAISPDRLATYQGAARAGGVDVLELYLWDRDLAAAALADIAVVEVALRNAMDTGLAELARGEDWYAVDLWRGGMHRAFLGGRAEAASVGRRSTRTWTLGVVNPVIALRNRAAHHELLVNGFPLPGESRRLSAQESHQACLRLARILNRDLASWLQNHSQLAERLSQRP